jgi:hypothetical protein
MTSKTVIRAAAPKTTISAITVRLSELPKEGLLDVESPFVAVGEGTPGIDSTSVSEVKGSLFATVASGVGVWATPFVAVASTRTSDHVVAHPNE